MSYPLLYESPDRPAKRPRGYFGIVASSAGILVIAVIFGSCAGWMPRFVSDFNPYFKIGFILGTPAIGLISGFVGLRKDIYSVLSRLGLLLNMLFWLLVVTGILILYLIGPHLP